jgi:hypothetical protein
MVLNKDVQTKQVENEDVSQPVDIVRDTDGLISTEPLRPIEPWRTTPNRITEIVTTMRDNSDKPHVQRWAGLAMYHFDWDDRACEHLVNTGGVEGLVAALTTHAANADVQLTLCSALSSVTMVPDGRLRAAKAGAAERLFATMSTHSSRPDVLEAAIRALLPLLWDEHIRSWIRNGGGTAAIQRCMLAHPAHVGVQEWGARALGCFAMDSGPRVRLGVGGGVDALVGALGALRDDPQALGAAKWALTAAALHKDNLARVLRSPPPRLRLVAEAFGQPPPAP